MFIVFLTPKSCSDDVEGLGGVIERNTAELCLSPSEYVEILIPQHFSVTVFKDKVFKEIIKLK